MQNNIVFLKKSEKSSQTKIVFLNTTMMSKCNLYNYIERLCNRNGSSIKVNRDTIRKNLKYSRNVPILVSQRDGLVMITTHSLDDERCIIINPNTIRTITCINKIHTNIEYVNNQSHIVKVKYTFLKKQLERAAVVRDFYMNANHTTFY